MYIFSKVTNNIYRISKEKGDWIMKNKKLLIVFILILTFLLANVTYVMATDNVDQLPTIVIDQDANNEETNNEQAPDNNEQTNNEQANNEENNNEELNIIANEEDNEEENVANDEKLPQTGVQGDALLVIFITVCIISAVYAYFRIRKYNDIH